MNKSSAVSSNTKRQRAYRARQTAQLHDLYDLSCELVTLLELARASVQSGSEEHLSLDSILPSRQALAEIRKALLSLT